MTMNRLNLGRLFLLFWISLSAIPVRAAVPEWIWHDNKGAKPADNEIHYFINGHKVIDAKGWDKATQEDVKKDIRQGENLIAVRGKNITAEAGVIVRLKLEL